MVFNLDLMCGLMINSTYVFSHNSQMLRQNVIAFGAPVQYCQLICARNLVDKPSNKDPILLTCNSFKASPIIMFTLAVM